MRMFKYVMKMKKLSRYKPNNLLKKKKKILIKVINNIIYTICIKNNIIIKFIF